MAEETATTTITPEAVTTEATVAAPKRRKVKRSVSHGQVHVQATFNNTIITITDTTGAVLTTASAGGCGFRGSKKGTAYAAQVASEKALNNAKQTFGLGKVDVFVKGVGLGREAAVRAIANFGMAVETITDKTGVPHGGCRPRKAPRN